MEYTGCLVDFFLNLIFQNGGLLRLFSNVLWGKVVVPQRGTETFVSTIGQIDGRLELYERQKFLQDLKDDKRRREAELGNQGLMDLCIIASKLAYENAQVVRNVVCYHWKIMDEEPNKNFFGKTYVISKHLNAKWKLIRSLMMEYMYGLEYKKGWLSLLAQVMGLVVPSIFARCPTNYVNSVRLGREFILYMSNIDVFSLDQ